MNILRRIFISLGTLIFVVCCGAFLLFGISGTGWKALAIPTGSMRPDMPPGSLALMHSVPASSLKVGDIINYTNPIKRNSTISHRIVMIYKTAGNIPVYVTKGDANKGADRPIAIGSVKGKVVWHVQDVGYLLLLAKNPFVILPIVYIAGLLIMAEEVKRLSDYYKLSQPYRIPSFKKNTKQSNVLRRNLVYGASITIALLLVSAALAPSAIAMLRSNTVALANNKLTVAAKIPPSNECTGSSNNDTTVNVNNSSTQSGTSGNASVTGNTTGGNATSGSVTSTNTSTTTVTITNC